MSIAVTDCHVNYFFEIESADSEGFVHREVKYVHRKDAEGADSFVMHIIGLLTVSKITSQHQL